MCQFPEVTVLNFNKYILIVCIKTFLGDGKTCNDVLQKVSNMVYDISLLEFCCTCHLSAKTDLAHAVVAWFYLWK